jgi:tight adherence protein C
MASSNIWALLAALLAFLAVMLFVVGLVRVLSEGRDRRRLQGAMPEGEAIAKPRGSAEHDQRAAERLQKILGSLSRLSVPAAGWQNDEVRLKFLQAGLSDPQSPLKYYALKTLLTVILPILVGVILWSAKPDAKLIVIAAAIFLLAAIGYYLPEFYLRRRTEGRVNEMRMLLPDVIDLLVICTESGLSLDQALGRVAQEVARTSPMVASEFHLVTLEIRAGAGRSDALRNLALRVKLDDLSNLASMMIQADRFGTGVAEALRIQSEMMRIKRMQRAEEAAAKIPTKMLLPLVFLIFPALMIVILGPAIIKLTQVFSDNPPWR